MFFIKVFPNLVFIFTTPACKIFKLRCIPNVINTFLQILLMKIYENYYLPNIRHVERNKKVFFKVFSKLAFNLTIPQLYNIQSKMHSKHGHYHFMILFMIIIVLIDFLLPGFISNYLHHSFFIYSCLSFLHCKFIVSPLF